MRYAVVIEKEDDNFCAYLPDVPGCVASGATPEEVEKLIHEAVIFHFAGLSEDGLPLPPATSRVEYIDIAT